MKKKTWATIALSAVVALFVGAGVSTVSYPAEEDVVTAAAETPYYEVDSVEIHPHSNTNTMLYMQMSTMDGQMALTGYNEWRAADDATNALKAQMQINGQSLADVEGAVLMYMDIANAFYIGSYYLADGGSIVIPEGATFDNGISSMKFMRTFTITWDAENAMYNVTRSSREIVVPDYDMPEGMLSDFTQNSVIRLADASFLEAAVNNPGNCWGGDYQSFKISGSYVSEEEAPEGSTNGAYKMSWEALATLYYPAIMFTFPQDVEFNLDDELVFRVYFSEGMDLGFDLWITSSLTPNIWDPQTRFAGVTLSKGEWIDLRVAAADYIDEEGKIAPIAFVFYYPTSLPVTPATDVYFDTATFVSVPKVLAEDYKTEDISEVIALGEGKEFVGQGDNGDEFDFETENNVQFVRKDTSVNAVKMKMTINDVSDFDIYFVLNGTNLYYTKGGVYFWLSEQGFNLGYNGKNFARTPLPDCVANNQAFELELRCIPYYVNGIKAGYFAQALINGEEVGESGYIASANCAFGNWFGFYMHNTSDAVTVKLQPVQQAETAPVALTLKAQMNATQIDADGYVKLETKVAGNYLNQSEVTYEIVSGGEYAMIDAEGYLNGIADGEVVVVGKVTNVFGTFTSNELKIVVGAGLPKAEQPQDSSNGPLSDVLALLGCAGTVSGITSGAIALGIAVVALLKKKED